MIEKKFLVEPHQAKTDLWKKLKAHMEARQLSLRKRLEGDLGEVETAKVRGQLVEIKLFLALDIPPPSIKPSDE
jgi:hypothetical protein